MPESDPYAKNGRPCHFRSNGAPQTCVANLCRDLAGPRISGSKFINPITLFAKPIQTAISIDHNFLSMHPFGLILSPLNAARSAEFIYAIKTCQKISSPAASPLRPKGRRPKRVLRGWNGTDPSKAIGRRHDVVRSAKHYAPTRLEATYVRAAGLTDTCL